MVSTRIPKQEQHQQQQQEKPIELQKTENLQQFSQPLRLLQPPIDRMDHPPNFQLHFNPPDKLKTQQQLNSKPTQNKRRRRKSRRQRKTPTHTIHEQVLEWADRIPVNHRSSGEGAELLENANNIAFAISLRKSAKVFNSTKQLNGIFDPPKSLKLETGKLISPPASIQLANSTYSVPSVDEERQNHRKQNLEHRNEVRWNDSVTYSVTSSITNKYNIDYDNKLEDDFEIIEKDE